LRRLRRAALHPIGGCGSRSCRIGGGGKRHSRGGGNAGGQYAVRRCLDDGRDPWMPRPGGLPPFFPDMSSQVSSQGKVRSPQESSPVSSWAAKASDTSQDIQSAVQSAQGAIGAGDVAGAKAACQQMSDANQRLNATLPTPVRALTSEVRGAVDEFGAASSVCLTAGPNAGQAEIDSFTSHLSAATAHFTRAQEIAAGAARPLPRPGLPN